MYRPSSLGRVFWHTLPLTGAPLVHRGQSKEVDWPYRYARPFILRLPRGRGLVLGWWRDHETLDVGRHLAECMVLGALPAPDVLEQGIMIQGDGEAWNGFRKAERLAVTASPVDHVRIMYHRTDRRVNRVPVTDNLHTPVTII